MKFQGEVRDERMRFPRPARSDNVAPGHEKYFDELRDLVAKGGKPDPEALAKLREKYDTVQLATLTTG